MKENWTHNEDLKIASQLYAQLIIEHNRMQNKKFFAKLDPNFTSTVNASRTESDDSDLYIGVNGRIKTDIL